MPHSRRKLPLVTGRELEDLDVCPLTSLFDRVMAENGTVVADALEVRPVDTAPCVTKLRGTKKISLAKKGRNLI